MKTRSAFCLLILLASTSLASQAQPSRRPSAQSTPFDASKFIGIWEYTDDPMQKRYFKVTEQTAKSFKFNEGWEWQGQISWPGTMVNRRDGIYLAPVEGKLRGTFVSPNFRATHGYDIRYTITLTPQRDGRLLYSITSQLAPEKHYATRVGDSASTVNSQQSRTSSDGWPQFWTTFRDAVRRRDRAALKQMMTVDFEWSFGGYPPGDQRDTFFQMMDKYRNWRALDKVLAQGTMLYQQGDPVRKNAISRVAPPREPGYDWRALFELGPDRRWRWVAFVSGD